MRQHSHNDSDIAAGLRKLDSSDAGGKSSIISQVQKKRKPTPRYYTLVMDIPYPISNAIQTAMSINHWGLGVRRRICKSWQIKHGHLHLLSEIHHFVSTNSFKDHTTGRSWLIKISGINDCFYIMCWLWNWMIPAKVCTTLTQQTSLHSLFTYLLNPTTQ